MNDLRAIAGSLVQVQNAGTKIDSFEMMQTLMAKPEMFQTQPLTETGINKLFQRLRFHMSEDKQKSVFFKSTVHLNFHFRSSIVRFLAQSLLFMLISYVKHFPLLPIIFQSLLVHFPILNHKIWRNLCFKFHICRLLFTQCQLQPFHMLIMQFFHRYAIILKFFPFNLLLNFHRRTINRLTIRINTVLKIQVLSRDDQANLNQFFFSEFQHTLDFILLSIALFSCFNPMSLFGTVL